MQIRRTILSIAVVALAVIGGKSGAPDGALAMEAGQLKRFEELRQPQACRVIDFEEVQIIPGIVNDTWFAIVSGTKPWITMKVTLVPLVYVRQPEYWGIEVVGCLEGIGLPATAPYSVTISLDSIRGKKGIEIIGATSTKEYPVPPK